MALKMGRDCTCTAATGCQALWGWLWPQERDRPPRLKSVFPRIHPLTSHGGEQGGTAGSAQGWAGRTSPGCGGSLSGLARRSPLLHGQLAGLPVTPHLGPVPTARPTHLLQPEASAQSQADGTRCDIWCSEARPLKATCFLVLDTER